MRATKVIDRELRNDVKIVRARIDGFSLLLIIGCMIFLGVILWKMALTG
jgi:hypothetical protein